MAKKSGHIVGPGDGAAATGAAYVPGTPTFVSNASGAITITWSANGNASVCDYVIYVEEAGLLLGYVQADGTVAAGEIWRTKAAWGTNVAVSGLTVYTAYKFKVKARDEADVATAYSALSATMNTLPTLDSGPTSDNLLREITGGNTRVYGTPTWTGNLADAATANVYYGDIIFTYVLQNEASDTSSIVVQFSENWDPTLETGDWYTATIGAGGDPITGLTSSSAGVSHTYSFDSYESCGKSEYETAVYLKITPKDAAADSGTASVIGPFGVKNLPAEMTWVNDDGYAWNKDTTPTWRAQIVSLRSGERGFPALHYYREEDGAGLTQNANSYEAIVGWEYETSLYAGIDVAFVNSNPDTITKTGGTSFVTLGFEAGETLTVLGSTSNDGTYTIATVGANTITLAGGDALTAEIAGDSVRLSIWAALTPAGILEAFCDNLNRVKYTPPSALAAGNYIITGEMWETRDLS